MSKRILPQRWAHRQGRKPSRALWPAAIGLALLVLMGGLKWVGPVQAQTGPSRGSLLYETHCIACHRAHVHWREQRLVKDWDGLVTQVRHWQSRAQLNWSEADVREVARFLNEAVYRLPAAPPRG